MGLFDHLFKSKTDSADEEHVEAAPPAEAAAPAGATLNVPPPKPPLIAPPDAFGPRSLGQVITPGRAGPPPSRPSPVPPPAGAAHAGEKSAREIVLTLDDVLNRIPADLLAGGAHDGRRVLRFAIDDLSADIARGRAAVPLSQIAAQYPDIFRVPITEDNDVLVRLPLQKLVEQIAPGGISSSLARGPAAEPADAKIHLSIAAILRTCPREIIVGELPPVADTERIVFPFAPIERQLPSGRVDVSSIRFVAALPLHMHEYFRAIEGVRVPLPLDEIFQNLPGQPAAAPAVAAIPTSAPAVSPAPSSFPGGVAWPAAPTPPPAHAPSAAPEGIAPSMPSPPPPVTVPATESTPVPKPVSPAAPMQPAHPILASGPLPVPRAAEPFSPKPPAAPPSSPPAPHLDLAKDEIAALRARIAALKVEFSVPAVAPVAPPRAEAPPVVAPPVPVSTPPIEVPPPAETPPPVAASPVPVAPPPAEAPPSAEIPPAVAPSSTSASEPLPPPAPPAPPAPFTPPPLGLEPAPASEPVSVLVPAPMPELFRPPLVPPPVAPVVITTPKIEPPAPVMLPVRIVAPPPARPHVAPPRLFSAGENIPLPEIHAPEPVLPPEPPAPPPPPPPPPLALDPAGTVLALEGPVTLARIAEHLATLPGLGACVLDVRHEAAEAGAFPEGSDATAIRALVAPLATALAGREGEHITIFGEHGSISVFARGAARVAILHRARVFLPGVREKLVATVTALAEA